MMSQHTSLPQEVHPDSYATWLVNEIAEDLNESITGVTHSPVKAANEVWRNCRHQLRIMMDDSGLSDTSRTFFYTRYAPSWPTKRASPGVAGADSRWRGETATPGCGYKSSIRPCHSGFDQIGETGSGYADPGEKDDQKRVIND